MSVTLTLGGAGYSKWYELSMNWGELAMFDVYRTYLGGAGKSRYERVMESARADLFNHAEDNPDYQPDTKRNGVVQPMILTRSGEDQSYNIICLPGDAVYAGDIIDAFDEKWIVMQARADATTHMTGVMHQCNNLFRFQNFSSEIVERWGYIKQSGYSSEVTGTNQMQKAEEQFAIYMSFDEGTSMMYTDKRLASHLEYDKYGQRSLSTFKVLAADQNTKFYNNGDHLLFIKAIRDVYSPTKDSLDELICDYIAPEAPVVPPMPEPEPEPVPVPTPDPTPTPIPTPEPELLKCEIIGTPKVLLGRSRTFKPAFYDGDGMDVTETVPEVWTYPDIPGITFSVTEGKLKISASKADELIGAEFEVTLADTAGYYEPAKMMVEVGNIA